MSFKSRGFALTLNNYTEIEYNNLKNGTVGTAKFWIFGKEVGEKGTPHIQGYIYFQHPRTFNGVIKLLDNKRIHVEKAKGSLLQNYTYCSKDGNFETNIDLHKNDKSPSAMKISNEEAQKHIDEAMTWTQYDKPVVSPTAEDYKNFLNDSYGILSDDEDD